MRIDNEVSNRTSPRLLRLNDLAGRLAKNDVLPHIAVPQGDALSLINEPIDGYIEPELEVQSWPQGATVVIIEAPGAVGKTTAAESLAARLRWPLVRTEKARVGSYSLSGLIQDATGFSSDYMQRISEGRGGVVVDSLDEAHFRVGTENFLAFLQNVRSAAGQLVEHRETPSVVLFSRTDTADLVRLDFENAETPLAHLKLTFFNRPASNAFIESYLRRRFDETRRPEYNVALAHSTSFRRMRDERFNQVLQVLMRSQEANLDADWDAHEDFLGYAPVLITLAESLATTNPSAERQAIKEAFSHNENDLLVGIVEKILDREQVKFQNQIQAKLEALTPADQAADFSAIQIYGREEQATRIFGMITKNPLSAPPPASLPPSVRETYETAAQQFVLDHPFVRGGGFTSIVFADYVRSMMCDNLTSRLALLRNPVEEIDNVGPFFMRFVHRAIIAGKGASVPEGLIEPLLQSWYLENELSTETTRHAMVVLGTEFDYLEFPPINPKVDDPTVIPIVAVSGVLHLTKPLRDVMIVTEQGLVLGDRTDTLTLGPNVIIAAAEIEIAATEINLGWSQKSRVVSLNADVLTAHHLTKISGQKSNLGIYVEEDLPPLLNTYRRELKSGPRWIPYSDFVDLRAILMTFRSSVHLGLCASADRLDGLIVKDNVERQRILAGLVDRGIVTGSGGWYRLDSSSLTDVGFSLSELKSGHPNSGMMSFLGESRYGSVQNSD